MNGLIIEGFEKPVYGTLVGLAHDNLGGNMLHGMVESFAAKNFCRICTIDKNEIQKQSSQDNNLLRTKTHYEDSYSKLNQDKIVSELKHKSVLNDLKYFHLSSNPSVDIMHDLLEGCVPHISLEFINNRITFYNYGPLVKDIKPSSILLDKPGSSVEQRAS